MTKNKKSSFLSWLSFKKVDDKKIKILETTKDTVSKIVKGVTEKQHVTKTKDTKTKDTNNNTIEYNSSHDTLKQEKTSDTNSHVSSELPLGLTTTKTLCHVHKNNIDCSDKDYSTSSVIATSQQNLNLLGNKFKDEILLKTNTILTNISALKANIAEAEYSNTTHDDMLINRENIQKNQSPFIVSTKNIEVISRSTTDAINKNGLSTNNKMRSISNTLFCRLKNSLIKTRKNIGYGFLGIFQDSKINNDLFKKLEEQLLIADVGVETSNKIIAGLIKYANKLKLKDTKVLYQKLHEDMAQLLLTIDKPLTIDNKQKPFIILTVGANGVGKTTTIAKLSHLYQADGKKVMLAAGDTFRAAAIEQIQIFGQRNHIQVISQHTGADSASVIFDAIKSARAQNMDVLIADTAGRLQNKCHLMEELKKIVRVIKKLDLEAPHEIILIIDASTGQNAISQAQLFNEAIGLTGIILTKLDGTAKGGVVFAIADRLQIPLLYIGIGESIEDLRTFNASDFINALFDQDS